MSAFYYLIDSIASPIVRFYNWLMRLTPGYNALVGLSFPMRCSLLTLLFLLILWAAAFIRKWKGLRVPEYPWWVWTSVAVLFIAVIPVIVYYLVKFWMIKEESRFPEIDRIWQEGIQTCATHGITLMEVPLFLVLGARDHRRASQLINASQLNFDIAVPTREEGDIVWFANSEAIFLFLNGCSSLSRLSSAPTGPAVTDRPSPRGQSDIPTGTIDVNMLGANAAAPTAPPPQVMQTLQDSALFPRASSPVRAALPMGVGATMQLPEGQGLADILPQLGSEPTSAAAPQMSSQDVFEREQKLKYVCQLIRKARHTLCPINGLLTLIPFELVESACAQIQTAAQKDLGILREQLMVRCPNTLLITEMDKEDGFQELVIRVGEERAREFRFGKGCEIWSPPDGDRLRAVAIHATGAFEDWTYMLFQEASALKRRSNSRLFSLLCRIRGKFSSNLQDILARGFGFDPHTDPHLAHEQFLFGGCYFAATGADPSRQAFVKSVFKKSMQQEGELEWAPAARKIDRQMQLLANLFALAGTAAMISIVAMLVIDYLNKPLVD